ncbi:MAG TPA: hypothetical protein VHW23_35600 [Kofleriaceae bacterium]|jgi:hypothetical protein|nr:hypothetical protein [Kofleriaceae bacterium]
MHNRSNSGHRFAGPLPGTFLGLAIATTLALFAGPVTADSKRGNGMKCESYSDCRSGNCDSSSHVCKSTNGEGFDDGAKCGSYSDCKSNNCSDGICKSRDGGNKLDNGAQCKSYSDCKSSNCDQGVCKSN